MVSKEVMSQSITEHKDHVGECVFCRIIDGSQEASVISRDEESGVIAFMDLQGYPLICPTDHIDSDPESIKENVQKILAVYGMAYTIAPLLYQSGEEDGVNIVANLGEAAGQEIPHFHVHVIPRVAKDHRLRFPREVSLPRVELDKRALSLSSKLLSLE